MQPTRFVVLVKSELSRDKATVKIGKCVKTVHKLGPHRLPMGVRRFSAY